MVKRGNSISPKRNIPKPPPSRGGTKSAMNSQRSTSSVEGSVKGSTKGSVKSKKSAKSRGPKTPGSRESRRSETEHRRVTIIPEELQAMGIRMVDMSAQGMTVLQNSLFSSK